MTVGSRCPIVAAMSSSRTRVVLADDDVLLRGGWRGCSTVPASRSSARRAEARSWSRSFASPAGACDRRHQDAADSHEQGLDAASSIREEFPETAIVVLTAHMQVERATELLASGERSGHLLKTRI